MALFSKKQQPTTEEMTDARFDELLNGSEEMPSLKEIMQMGRYFKTRPEKKALWERKLAERQASSGASSTSAPTPPGRMQS